MLYSVPPATQVLVMRAEDVEDAVRLAQHMERADVFSGHILVCGSKISVQRLKDAPDELIEACKSEIRSRK